MPTVRRLMNKKAFEEMELLKIRCDVENKTSEKYYVPCLKLDENGKEIFCIIICNKNSFNIESFENAKSYTEIEKKFTKYVNGK